MLASNNKQFHTIKKTLSSEKVLLFVIVIFLIGSICFINPIFKRKSAIYRSTQLERIIKQDGNTERIDYVDAEGRKAIAADLGYATKIVTNKYFERLEHYYDDFGKPIRRYTGYYAVLREYDEKGNNIQITYLNEKDEPLNTLSGYAIEKREYNEKEQIIKVRYYDAEGYPICTASYGFGKNNEFDEAGNISRITYVDVSGNPWTTQMGYASIERKFYITDGPDKGKVESEFYFDTKGQPVALSLGQYGLHKEYNELGQETSFTYLDTTGKPMVTNKGYTTVVRTFKVDNSVATEMYYDLKGNPFQLSEGQYGIKKEEGKTVYLNQNGREVFNLKRLLYNHSRIAIVFAAIAVILSVISNRKWNVILLGIYIVILIYLTLLFRDDEGTKKTELLWYYRKFFSSSDARADIIKNIWLFIPFGTILWRLYTKKYVLFVPLLVSVLIEGIQHFTNTGFCELDDIISNSLGGFIGFYAGKLTINIFERINRRQQIHSV